MRTVEFNVRAERDWTDVRGNAMCSGDNDFDKECEDKIIADLNDGNIWAWASVCCHLTPVTYHLSPVPGGAGRINLVFCPGCYFSCLCRGL